MGQGSGDEARFLSHDWRSHDWRSQSDCLGNRAVQATRRSGPICSVLLLFLVWVLAGCAAAQTAEPASGVEGLLPSGSTVTPISQATGSDGAGAKPAPVSLTVMPKGIKHEPLPLRAGFPFTITVPIHNNQPVPALGVPVMVYLSANQEQIGFSSFFQVLTVTVAATDTLALKIPVVCNLAGGEYQLWVQVNRLSVPVAQQAGTPTLPEIDIGDNSALLDLTIAPFDAYVSDLCPGRIDVALESGEIWLEPDLQSIHVRVHNLGNQAVYNLPVVAIGKREGQSHDWRSQSDGVAYTPAIPPCGGTAEVVVELDRPLEAGECVDLAVNPEEWPRLPEAIGLAEDSFDNNVVRSWSAEAAAGQAGSGAGGPGGGVITDYDFAISSADVEMVRPGVVLLKVHNLGTRDAADVSIRMEGKAGRKVVDVIPFVEGDGFGVAAIQLGWLWSPKATLTLIVNPEGAKGAYPEANRDNNVVTFTLP